MATRKKSLFLDYGCGEGRFSRFIKEELKTDIIGIDLSGGMVRYASKKRNGVNYLVADCHNLPFRDRTFDAVVGVGIFHHLNLRKAIFECSRILRKSGLLIAFEPNSLGLFSFIGRKFFKTRIHTPHERTYTHWSFISEIRRCGFKIIDARFLSFFGFIFPFIWASKFAKSFAFLKGYTKDIKTVDKLFEKISITKYLCWQVSYKFKKLGMSTAKNRFRV